MDGNSLARCRMMPHTTEERPVYWKLLKQVLANLGLTEEQWMERYVDK